MNYLEGKSIKLVKFTDGFITAEYVSWLNDHNINRYLCTGRILVARKDMYAPNDDSNLMFAIMSNMSIDSEGKKLKDKDYVHYIGTLSLHDISWIDRKGEIGYMIGSKDHWGMGIASEAISLVTDYAFNRLNLNKVSAGVVDGNVGSSRALEKNGFKQYGTIPQDYFLEGKFLDGIRFYKLQGWQ
jgi:RimJ/RimL family protein N-acetyltransferase